MNCAAPAIEISDLTVSYGGTHALDTLNATINRGAQVAVVGPNGAGKSTLFKVIVGLLRPSTGRVSICGQPLDRQIASLAYVPQREEIDWRFPVTVLDVVLMGRYRKVGWLRRPGREDRAIAARCLRQLDIEVLASRGIGELSGGQQQRVFLARALAQEPDILILDEPFAGVDSPTQEAILAVLSGLREHAITILLSTHDLALAASRFDCLMLLNRKLIAIGPPSTALTPSTFAAAFGAQGLFHRDGQGFLALPDSCCAPYAPPYAPPSHRSYTEGARRERHA